MRTLVFDLAGDYALFKKPYSPMSPVSFPVPPPPAVLGMLGAVLGYAKDAYHQRLGWEQVRVAVALRAPVRIFRAALNFLQTRSGTDQFFRPIAGQNTHTQVPCEFLYQPRFRIYVAGLTDPVANELAARLKSGNTAYTVSLGLAQCLADITWVGEGQAEPLNRNEWISDTVVPLHPGIQICYEEGRRYQRLRIPAVMDDERIVQRYQEIVLAEDEEPLQGQGGSGVIYVVGSDTIAFL